MEWMVMPLKRYAQFSGRSRRKEYWMFLLLNVIVYVVLGALLFAGGMGEAFLGDDLGAADPEFGVLGTIAMLLIGLWALGTIIPNIALQVRRLHDLGFTGWIYLGVILAGFIPIIGGLIQLGFLVWMAVPGTEGPNQYGDDPKDLANLSVFE